jgi:hypothetical protein
VIVRAAAAKTLDALAATVTGRALMQAATDKALSAIGLVATGRTEGAAFNPAWAVALWAGQD